MKTIVSLFVLLFSFTLASVAWGQYPTRVDPTRADTTRLRYAYTDDSGNRIYVPFDSARDKACARIWGSILEGDKLNSRRPWHSDYWQPTVHGEPPDERISRLEYRVDSLQKAIRILSARPALRGSLGHRSATSTAVYYRISAKRFKRMAQEMMR